MALIYRANHVVNFAQAELGLVPAGLGVLLIVFSDVPYWVGLLVAVAAGPVLGAGRAGRDQAVPQLARLILTVATIGLAQLLALGALLLPAIWDENPSTYRVAPPFDFSFTIEPIVFSSHELMAAIVAPLAVLGIWLFLTRTRVGVAVQASAQSLERRPRSASRRPASRPSSGPWPGCWQPPPPICGRA